MESVGYANIRARHAFKILQLFVKRARADYISSIIDV